MNGHISNLNKLLFGMTVCGSLVQFPLLGIAAQASPFDEQDAPDKTPRGSFNAQSTMVRIHRRIQYY